MRVYVAIGSGDEFEDVVAVASSRAGAEQGIERALAGGAVVSTHRKPGEWEAFRVEEWDLDGDWIGYFDYAEARPRK